MTIIKVEGKPPVLIQDKKITHFEIKPLKFAAFVKLAEETNNITGGDRKKFSLLNRRARMKKQVTAYAGELALLLGDLEISQLPLTYGIQINKAIDEEGGESGILVNPNDSITAPTLYKLGTPIKFQQNSDGGEFSEIEFIARTFGDIEEIMAETGEPQQMLAALRTIAKPLGASDTLLTMPSWAIDEITINDGFTMIEKVLPRFFG